jgi:Tannase-like family of unknown function (DUF6351)
MKFTSLITLGVVLVVAPVSAQRARDVYEVRTLSARADMVTGGNVLILMTTPPPAPDVVSVTVNGREAKSEIGPGVLPGTFVARLEDLQIGKNVIEIGQKGQKPAARLAVVNHPITGPVFSGPHQTPFTCETQALGLGAALDVDCSVARRVDYFYRSGTSSSAQANPFKPIDLNAPRPADVAMTTTLEGKSVPYIVRREMGTINRAVYVIAFLHEPGTPLPDPWTSSGLSWNGRLIYSFGAGCQAGYHQGRNIGGLMSNWSFLGETQLDDYAIERGYAVASSSLNAFGTSCADVISAETMMMVKEHFIEQYGVPRYTIGSGRSGGSMQQHLIANNYPGLLDGMIPTAAFADTVSWITHLADCELLDEAFKHSPLSWSDDEKAAVAGEANWQFCARNGTGFPVLRPMYCDRTGVSADQVYDPKRNPKGVRCTYQDNMVNIFGRDPKTGFARRPFDNIGVQYGLKALNDGKITFEQFLDVNRHVGGHDIDGNVIADRTVADPEALRIAFQSGRVNDASQGMAAIPIIDVRPYTDGTGDVHDVVNSHITRARLVAANGTSGNQVLRTYAPGTDIPQVQHDNLDDMERWLAAIANDNAPARTPLEKVIRSRPATVTDACYTREGEQITDMRRCEQMFPVYSNPRLAAGMPIEATMLKCELKPVDGKDYSVPLTAVQFAAIKAAFPAGVCDYTRKGAAVRAPGDWLSYERRD